MILGIIKKIGCLCRCGLKFVNTKNVFFNLKNNKRIKIIVIKIGLKILGLFMLFLRK